MQDRAWEELLELRTGIVSVGEREKERGRAHRRGGGAARQGERGSQAGLGCGAGSQGT